MQIPCPIPATAIGFLTNLYGPETTSFLVWSNGKGVPFPIVTKTNALDNPIKLNPINKVKLKKAWFPSIGFSVKLWSIILGIITNVISQIPESKQSAIVDNFTNALKQSIVKTH